MLGVDRIKPLRVNGLTNDIIKIWLEALQAMPQDNRKEPNRTVRITLSEAFQATRNVRIEVGTDDDIVSLLEREYGRIATIVSHASTPTYYPSGCFGSSKQCSIPSALIDRLNDVLNTYNNAIQRLKGSAEPPVASTALAAARARGTGAVPLSGLHIDGAS